MSPAGRVPGARRAFEGRGFVQRLTGGPGGRVVAARPPGPHRNAARPGGCRYGPRRARRGPRGGQGPFGPRPARGAAKEPPGFPGRLARIPLFIGGGLRRAAACGEGERAPQPAATRTGRAARLSAARPPRGAAHILCATTG